MESKSEIERKLYSDLAAMVEEMNRITYGKKLPREESNEMGIHDAAFITKLLDQIKEEVAWKKVSERILRDTMTDITYVMEVRLNSGELDYRLAQRIPQP
jgi:hypothetical protein